VHLCQQHHNHLHHGWESLNGQGYQNPRHGHWRASYDAWQDALQFPAVKSLMLVPTFGRQARCMPIWSKWVLKTAKIGKINLTFIVFVFRMRKANSYIVIF
jgi:hypothetical protein